MSIYCGGKRMAKQSGSSHSHREAKQSSLLWTGSREGKYKEPGPDRSRKDMTPN